MAVALSLALLLGVAAPSLAANKYCDGQPFWLPSGVAVKGTNDWSSVGAGAAFHMGPCVGLSGIGMTETHKKTIIIIDRAAAQNGYITLPANATERAYAQEIVLATGKQRGLDVITNTFCSSGQHMPNGDLFSIGGDWSPDYAGPGEFSIRSFAPCVDGACDFKITGQLARSRWYPTTILLGDGRLMIVGGSSTGVGLNSIPNNVPYIEYFPPTKGAADAYQTDFLVDALPYNLYPFTYLLPSGNVFIFAGNTWTLWSTLKNAMIAGEYPAIDAQDANGNQIKFSYPTAGTAAMFPLTSANKYTAEIMICGGAGTGAIYFQGNDLGGKAKVVDDPLYPTSNKCFRIQPEGAAPAWTEEEMKLPRVMPVAVLLPDGHMVVLSGTQQGHSGLGDLSHKPALTPELYDTATNTWFKGALPASKIPRSYHNSAVLLHDGTVFVSGSAPHDTIIQGPEDFPTEFRTEFFHPPYMMAGKVPPVLVAAPAAAAHGGIVTVAFKYTGAATKVQVVLSQPGFSTHGGNHGMRQVVLDIKPPKVAGAMHTVSALVPANKNLLPPTWYWLFVVVNGVPNREGHYVFIQ